MFLNQRVDHTMTFKNVPELEKETAKVIYRFEKTRSFDHSGFKITTEQIRVSISFLLKSWFLWPPQLKILL